MRRPLPSAEIPVALLGQARHAVVVHGDAGLDAGVAARALLEVDDEGLAALDGLGVDHDLQLLVQARALFRPVVVAGRDARFLRGDQARRLLQCLQEARAIGEAPADLVDRKDQDVGRHQGRVSRRPRLELAQEGVFAERGVGHQVTHRAVAPVGAHRLDEAA